MIIELEESEVLVLWAILINEFGTPKMKKHLEGYALKTNKNHPVIKSLVDKMDSIIRGEKEEPFYLR